MRNGMAEYTNRLDGIASRFWDIGCQKFGGADSQRKKEALYVLYNDARIDGCAQLMVTDMYDTFDRFDLEVHGES